MRLVTVHSQKPVETDGCSKPKAKRCEWYSAGSDAGGNQSEYASSSDSVASSNSDSEEGVTASYNCDVAIVAVVLSKATDENGLVEGLNGGRGDVHKEWTP